MGVYEELQQRLELAGLRPSARRGQNFLLDANQLQFIADLACLSADDVVLEVGPGSGLLTRWLARSGCLVLGVELDSGLLAIAREETAGLPNVFYMRADILAGKNRINSDVLTRLRELPAVNGGGRTGGKSPSGSLKCVSNLPYSAGTPFVLNLLSSPLPWSLGVFLLQLEVGERLIAAPGSREYGALSIAARLAAQTTIERVVSPRAFWPRPKVDSAVVRMEFLPVAERTALPWRALRAVTRAVFGSRRKILRNAFKDLAQPQDPTALLRQAGLDPEGRGENLRPDEFLGLARLVSSRPDSEWEE